MEELVKTFHIDIKLLIAQAVNFAIVVFVLFKFAYKPLLKHMNDRSDVIQKGLDDAKKAQQQMESTEKATEERMQQAKREARELIEKAQQQAEKNKEIVVTEARQEAEKVVEQAKAHISSEKEKMLQEVKKEIGGLVALATEKIVKKKVDQNDQEFVDEVVKKIN